jgi:hypothetical protein
MATYRKSLPLKNKDEFIQLVLQYYQDDNHDRQDWAERRLQRYAKLFGWLEPKNYPWPNASNQHIPMLMTNSLRTQDTLHNAVLTSRPTMSAIAVNKGDAEKGKQIDSLLDYQFFVEQNGEEKVAQLIDSYVNDGRFVAFVPWVKEKRKARELHPLPAVAPGLDPRPTVELVLGEMFPEASAKQVSSTKYKLTYDPDPMQEPQEIEAEYYEEDGSYYLCLTKEKIIFDGPCPIPKPLEDIVVPSRCENLQPPSPSNPLGADHVIMVDYPSWDEIYRLYKRGYYDLLTEEDIEELEGRVEAGIGNTAISEDVGIEQQKVLQDTLAGQVHGTSKSAAKTFTRLTFFGRYKLRDNEFEEEVVARLILGSNNDIKAVCRLRYLDEEFPRQDLANPRPFAVSPAFIPIPGQWFGVGMLELLEHMHDLTKILLDQMVDKHTLSNIPFFLFRATSGVRPETIRMAPGEGYPVSNPKEDFVFPSMPLQDQTIALNLISMVQQWSERQSMQGALQMGGVPQGKASALRTSTNMMSVLQQGDARPEHILRRFFKGLSEIFKQMHELNKIYLPKNKQYRVVGVAHQGADPYQEVKDPKDIGGMFQFDFKANALNTNKAITAQILSELLPVVVNGMSLQLGLTNPEKIYNLLRDLVQSKGQDEHKYLTAPPNSDVPKITAQEAMGQMFQGILPTGMPAEGAQVHIQTLQAFQQDPRFMNELQNDPALQLIYQTYLQGVQILAQQEQIQAQMAQQFAQAMGGGGGQPGPEGSVQPGADQMTPQGQGQVMDESMPGAKGQM